MPSARKCNPARREMPELLKCETRPRSLSRNDRIRGSSPVPEQYSHGINVALDFKICVE